MIGEPRQQTPTRSVPKVSAYLYISALALFFIIGRVASFKVIPLD